MSTFEDYAALARHLSELRRAGERDVADDTSRRNAGQAEVEQVGHRLAQQQLRLQQFAQAIGRPPPEVTPLTAGPVGDGGWPTSPPVSGPPVSGPPVSGAPVSGAPGFGGPANGAAPPGRSGVDAYHGLPVEATRLALPTTMPATAAGVPAPRPPAELDPAAELLRARQAADGADGALSAAEALAQQPPLLPTWSPMARALAVYTGCALVGILLMFVMVLASGIGVVGMGTVYAWMCAGLPAVSFFAGWLLLGRYGKPALTAGTPPRYVHFGFLISFVLFPVAYCAYLLLFRFFRG